VGWIKRVFKAIILVFLVAVFAFFVIGLIPDSVEIPRGTNGRHLELGKVKLRVLQAGSGPDVLFIHGLPGTIEDWEPMVKPLVPSFRLTFFDRPGHGHSSAEGHQYTLESNVRVALQLIERLGLKEVTVVGHSYGAAVAMAMAARDPSSVRAYVMVGGVVTYYPGREVPTALQLVQIPILGRGLSAAMSPLFGPTMVEEGVREAFFPNRDKMPPGFIERAKRIWLSTKVTVTTAREKSNLARCQQELMKKYSRIAEIKGKIVLVHGGEDQTVHKRHSIDAHRKLPRSKLVLVPGVGHYVQFADPGQLVEIIRDAAQPQRRKSEKRPRRAR
jgi:pimeloyl-ACP methyl ester carboxylesterase